MEPPLSLAQEITNLHINPPSALAAAPEILNENYWRQRSELLEKKVVELENEISALRNASREPPSPIFGRINVVQNVHQDDIHCIIILANGTFISGSKDGSLKKWSNDGVLIRYMIEPDKIDYTKWITALTKVNESLWISGTRDGEIDLWTTEGDHKKTLQAFHAPFPKNSVLCKNRNKDRVNCLTSFEDHTHQPFFLAGWATQFTLHNHEKDLNLRYTVTSNNDWVYAIEPVNASNLLVVTGCRLDHYTKDQKHNWYQQRALIKEDRTIQPRPFISAITPIKEINGKYGLAFFDGSARIYDINAERFSFIGKEHLNRVWTIENITAHVFASCADDGFIKLWDTRQAPKSIFSVKDNETTPSRVSVIKNLGNNQLLSGSCPDDVRKSATKAQFSFWDLRSLS